MTTNHSTPFSSGQPSQSSFSSEPLLYQQQPISAQAVLSCIQLLPTPALIYSGGSGVAETPASLSKDSTLSPRHAILSWSPQRYLIARNGAQLNSLVSELKAGSENPTQKTAANTQRSNESRANFKTGWMGYFSYDAGEWLAGLAGSRHPYANALSSGTPLAEFGYYQISVLLDLDADKAKLQNPLGLNQEQVDGFLKPLHLALEQTSKERNAGESPQQREWLPQWSRQEYDKAFRSVQDYLTAGDAYQVNLTMPFRCAADLTQSSPKPLLQDFDAPFSCYWKSDQVTLTSVSPERFIAIQGQTLTTSPIKGTVARGESEQEDRKNLDWLRHSEKNQAENLMIVDLLRNDLGKSAAVGSVQVEKLFDIESHANVHHMVSTISARLASETPPVTALLSAFPGGSVTGAPKRRAMEIIAELETGPRGLYCGSFGYFDDEGHCDFNILIRSVVATKTGAEIWAGGAIVVDSNPDEEYAELIQKVARIMATNI